MTKQTDYVRIPRYGTGSGKIRALLKECNAEYIMVDTGTGCENDNYSNAVRKMYDTAHSTNAGIVYSDLTRTAGGCEISHPLADWQSGSIRDDFDFGTLILFSQTAIRYYLSQNLEECNYAGFYQLWLTVSEQFPIVHIKEPLYSAVENDVRNSGQKQFDYVDPRNRAVQIELESVCTEHLKRIGGWLSPDYFREIDTFNPKEDFPVTASVIIPVRNRERTIKDAVLSALSQQTDFDFNIIVVDNHSTDSTTPILNELSAKERRVIHIIPPQTDLGIGGCWNLAINDPRCGRFAIQLDSDDLYSGINTLSRIVGKFKMEKCAMVIGSYRMCDFNLNTLPPGIIDHREWTDNNGPNNALRINGLGAPRAFYTPLARRIGFPNVSYGEDYALAIRISGMYRIGRIYDELYLCRRWDGNSDAALSPEKVSANNSYKDSLRTAELERRIKTVSQQQ